MSVTPHDALFKAVFDDPALAAGQLRAALPADLAAALDWSRLALVPGSLVDAELATQHTDLLFAVPWRGAGDAGARRVFLLYEHQSTPDADMPFRLGRYLFGIWERWRADHPAARTLPPIIPVVLYHGPAAWSAPPSLEDMLDVPAARRPALGAAALRLTYALDDLSAVSDAALRARGAAPLGTLALLCLKHARTDPDFVARLAGWLDVLAAVLAAPRGRDAVRALLRYILVVNGADPAALAALLERAGAPEEKERLMNYFERAVQEGELRGELRGEARGQQRGKAALLWGLICQRFPGEADGAAERRVAAAPVEQLDRWTVRLLSAPTLAALLDG